MASPEEIAQEIGDSVELEEADSQSQEGYTEYLVTFPEYQKQAVYQRLLELEKTGLEVDDEVRELIIERGAQGQPLQALSAQFIISVEDSKLEKMYGGSSI